MGESDRHAIGRIATRFAVQNAKLTLDIGNGHAENNYRGSPNRSDQRTPRTAMRGFLFFQGPLISP